MEEKKCYSYFTNWDMKQRMSLGMFLSAAGCAEAGHDQ